MTKILFYDKYVSGHHLEYIRHLVHYCRNNQDCEVLFAILQEGINQVSLKETTSLQFIPLPTFKYKRHLPQTIEEGEWLRSLITEEQITDVFFLAVDPYQYLLGTSSFRKLTCNLHGILFSPPHRLIPASDSPIKEKVRQKLRQLRKNWQLRWTLRNNQLKSLFVLDDPEGVEILNKRFRSVFKLLHDPIEQPKEIGNYSTKKNQKENQTEKFLLAFGSIIPRKNLVNIISSLKYTKEELVTLLIVGKGSLDYVNDLLEIAKQYDGNDRINVAIENRFISEEEMRALFVEATGIIMVYRNFYGSSGVLGHSASYRKPVLVSNEGLVAALTKRYKLGYPVEESPESIASGLQTLLTQGAPSGYNAKGYLEPKTVTNFGDTLFLALSDQ